jgi:protein O-GlcNAc transferase
MTGDTTQPPDKTQAQAKFMEGWNFHQRGQIGPAWECYQQAIALDPLHFDALHLAGIIAAQARLFDQAAALIAQAIAVDPRNAAAHYNLGNVLQDMQHFADAVVSYDNAIALDPTSADPYNNRGNAQWKLRQYDAALASYDAALRLHPGYAEAHNNRGNTLRDMKRAEEALASYDQAIVLKPDFADAHNNRGNVLRDLKRAQEAAQSCDAAIRLRPDFAEAYNNRANAQKDLGQLEAALASYDRAVQLKPDYSDAIYNRGATLRLMKRPEAAVDAYTTVLRLRSDHSDAYNGRGLAHYDMRAYAAAVADYDAAIRLKPNYAEAYNNRGRALSELKRHAAAIESYDAAIRLKPDYAEAYNNRGVSQRDLKQHDAALASYDRAIALNPGSAEAHNNRGISLSDVRRHEEAIASYAKAYALKPDYAFLLGALLHARMHICDWSSFNSELTDLTAKVGAGIPTGAPFPILALIDAPDIHLKAAETWRRAEWPRNPAPGLQPKRRPGTRIRVGYFSMDFRNHPVGLLMAGVIEAHDRQKFETIAFSFGPDTQDRIRRRMEAGFDKFLDVRDASDRDIAQMARELEIDIAVDLAGYTEGARTGVFAIGAAPIQVNYLGYPGSMGADFYHYILADATCVPDDARNYFSEKVVHLPHSYQANDAAREVDEGPVTREAAGLPAEGFVFCSFNNNFKITPAIFDIWMRILRRVAGSVLWLLEDNAAAARNLGREAERRGIDPTRLVFAPRTTYAQHLARHRLADLFLDTLPYNAHTTASDALWVGLPLLTLPGRAFPARVAASILTAVDMPELIASSLNDYEDKAVALASGPAQMENLRAKLARNRLTAPLFNAQLMARHLEAAYSHMLARHDAGLAPDHFKVTAL